MKSLRTPHTGLPHRAFWQWTYWRDAGSRAEARATVISFRNSSKDALSRINLEVGLIPPADVPLLEGDLEYTFSPEDCPFPVSHVFIVSDRVRRVLESEAPDNCQFFPIQLWHNGNVETAVYWALHVVHTLDCADRKRSYMMPDGHIVRKVIDETKVPPHISIFRVKDAHTSIIVRDSLRRQLLKVKATGSSFISP